MAMSEAAAMWRERAATLREAANRVGDADRQRTILTLAHDCEELATELEEAAAAEKT